MKVIKRINVSLSGNDLQCPVKVVAGNTGIQLVLKYVDFKIPVGTVATLFVRKPSGKSVRQTANITTDTEENTVTIDLQNQAIIEKGHAHFTVTLKNGEDTISTFSNYFDVDRNNEDSLAEESENVGIDNNAHDFVLKIEVDDAIGNINASHITIESGNIDYVVSKIKNYEKVNVLCKLSYVYGGATFYSVFKPESVIAGLSEGMPMLNIEFMANQIPGWSSTLYRVYVHIENNSDISVEVSYE